MTYSVPEATAGQPSMIGVIKRCARLIAKVPLGSIEPHLINFGTLPSDDPLLNRILPRVRRHKLPWGVSPAEFDEFCRLLNPQVVVLGEGPGGGMMRLAHNCATVRRIPQICIENFYRPSHFETLRRAHPSIQQWLLLGLPDGCPFGKLSDRVTLVPPMLAQLSPDLSTEVKVSILGYDETVARAGIELLSRLPAKTTARLFCPTNVAAALKREHRYSEDGYLKISGMPSDAALRFHLETSNVIVCKAGYQQLVEALAVGTPVVAYHLPGTVPESWLSSSLKPFARYFPTPPSDWSRLLSAVAVWIEKRPVMPWLKELQKIADPTKFAAKSFLDLVDRCLG